MPISRALVNPLRYCGSSPHFWGQSRLVDLLHNLLHSGCATQRDGLRCHNESRRVPLAATRGGLQRFGSAAHAPYAARQTSPSSRPSLRRF